MTLVKYLKQMIKVLLDDFKMNKTACEAFSVTVDYPIKNMEDWFRRLDTYGHPVHVR